MSQITAGETITLTVDGASLKVKIEDASKGDVFSAKVLAGGSSAYTDGQIVEFDRNILA